MSHWDVLLHSLLYACSHTLEPAQAEYQRHKTPASGNLHTFQTLSRSNSTPWTCAYPKSHSQVDGIRRPGIYIHLIPLHDALHHQMSM
jgi:hypothetical protein